VVTAAGTTADTTNPVIAPGDPAFYLDPDPACRWLHEHAPVFWSEPQQLWVLSKWDDIRFASRNPDRFSSAGGTLLPRKRVRVPNLLEMDPPTHALHRQLVNRAFSPRMVTDLEPAIRRIVRDCLDAIDPREVNDFVTCLAVPLPILIIAQMLGIPPGDLDDFKRWTDAVASSTNTDANVGVEMFDYFQGQLDDRSRHPRDDLLTGLLRAEVDGERLTRPEIVGIVAFLLVAGNETTRNLISGGVRTLNGFPDQKAKLATDASLLPAAVEEILRWVTPVRWFARTATTDVELRGQTIGADDYVLLLYRAGNRDPDVWADPYTFDVTRPAKPHVAFGHGEHLCIGAALARLEARVMFEVLLSRHPHFELAGDVRTLPSALLNAIESMPILLEP
jgi:cytochrome P450